MIDRNKLVHDLMEELKLYEADGRTDWRKVSIELGKRHGIVMTENACRKANKRHMCGVKSDTVFASEDPSVSKNETVHVEMLEGGIQISDRRIMLSETDMKDPDFVIKAHGYDPNKWIIMSATNNLWDANNGKLGLAHLYQSKIKVRPRDPGELTRSEILEIVAEFRPMSSPVRLRPIQNSPDKLALEIDLADLHIGSLSWHLEVGENNDYKIAMAKLDGIVDQAILLCDQYPIEKIILCFLGDFFHIDTEAMTTVKGTKVDFDSRPKKMIMKGLESILRIIDALMFVPMEIYWIEGNHSKNVEFAVFNSLPYIYSKAKHIKFDVSPRERKAFVYGSNLVGLHHGEIGKEARFTWLQNEFRKEWGECTYAETHSGHLHHEAVDEKGGIISRTNPSPKPVDKYEYGEGYVSNKVVLAYVWHKDQHLKSVHYLR